MLDFNVFRNCYELLASSKNISISAKTMEITYLLYQNDFTNEQFSLAVLEIIKKETLYNFIDPALFNKYKPLNPEKEFFLYVCRDYMQQEVLFEYYKQYFDEHLTEFQKRVLRAVGGIKDCWQYCHSVYGKYLADRAENRLKMISETYDSYSALNYGQEDLAINEQGKKQVNKIVQNLTSKLSVLPNKS